MSRAKQITFTDTYGVSAFPYGRALIDMARAWRESGSLPVFWIENVKGAARPVFSAQQPAGEPFSRVIVREDLTGEPLPATVEYLDRVGIPVLELTMPGGEARVYYPKSFARFEPLTGRVYSVFQADCYSLVREYLADVFKVQLPDGAAEQANEYARRFGRSFVVSGMMELGFEQVAVARKGDVVVIGQQGEPEHVGILVEDGTLLHHPANRLSCIEPYDGYWERSTLHILRHPKVGA